jgi:UDP-glucose 4-epimerase
MRILVTGGAGFIGSHIVDACLAQGHEVAVVDDLSGGAAANVSPRARAYWIDVRSRELDEVIAAERPEIVSHHAARVGVGRVTDDTVGDAEVNVLGSLNVMEAARRHGVRRLVLASSGGAIYDEGDGLAADESHRCRPRSPYAAAKLAVEQYVDAYRDRGLETVVLRYAHVYGPRQAPGGEAAVVARFIERLLAGLAPTIFGDGEQERDFVHVDDVVRANLAAHAVAVVAAPPPIFNVGTGRGTSVGALWQALARLAGSTASPSRAPARRGELVRSVLDATRARRVLGWEPQIELEPGLQHTWAWFAARTEPARVAA